MKIKFHSEARREFFKASAHYEEQAVGLGNDFIDKVEGVLAVIAKQPFSGTKVTEKEQRFLVSDFPYAIIYSVENDLITIFAAMDLRRKPGYWKYRT